MRWRQAFMAEVIEALHQFGMNACPVCRSANTLSIGPLPAIIIDGDLSAGIDDLIREEPAADLTLAIRIECTTCGYLMFFNSEKYRTADEKILQLGTLGESESQSEDDT